MSSARFLLSRRWILFFLVVVALAWVAWRLGEWQFHRLEERKDRNAIIEHNLEAEPAPVTEVMSTDEGIAEDEQWRHVRATGEYDVENTVIVRYRTRDGASGADVVVPLITDDGTALIVDRGWMETDNQGARPDDVPAPPPGEVTVTGWVRQDATGDSTSVTDHSTRAISSDQIGDATGLTTFDGFLEAQSEDPEPEEAIERPELPELGNGPHFFYGLQWWFFGLLAIVGFCYFAYDEWRRGPRKDRRPGRSSECTQHATVDRNHRASEEA